MATIQELQEELAAVEAAIAERDQVIQKQAAQLKAEDDKHTGWLVQAANPTYDGLLYDVIEFRSGLAFVPVGTEVKYFSHKPMSEEAIKAYPEKEREAIREREKISTAELAVKRMAADFGYQVKYFTHDQTDELNQIKANRAEERRRVELATAEAAKIAKLAGMGR